MKAPFSTQIPTTLKRQASATVAGMKRDVDGRFSLSQLVTDALLKHIAELERQHHSGDPWPPLKTPEQE